MVHWAATRFRSFRPKTAKGDLVSANEPDQTMQTSLAYAPVDVSMARVSRGVMWRTQTKLL